MEGVARVSDRLSALRRARFVGRSEERALFQQALGSEPPPFQVAFVFGPGGIGKSSLLREFGDLCHDVGGSVVRLDAREIDPSPMGFTASLRRALGIGETDDPVEALAARPERQVLLIDTYEALAPLDNWLRETFLPQLPEHVLVVLAGRNAPFPSWRTDPGWQQLLRILPLRNLAPDESRAYLSHRSVPADQHQAVLDFTHGHPLALSLVADAFAQRGPFHFEPEAAPDIVGTLVESLVQKVEPEQRAALEVCALVRVTTESLLVALLDIPDAHDVFAWLRSLSFVEAAPQGLFPHDLAREALAADLRWRHRDRYAELHERARAYYAGRLQQTRGQEQQRILFDYVFLHRDNPLMRPYLEWQETGATMPDSLHESDRSTLLAMVEGHEGKESARWLEFWLDRQPQGLVVYRDAHGSPIGLLAQVALHEAAPADRMADPATQAAWRCLEENAPLRLGEGATLFRFWMAADTYQAVSALQSLIFGRAAQHYLTTPALAFSFFPVADVDFWTPMFSYVDLPRLPRAEFDVGERHYGVFAHDWRVRSPMAWLSLLGQREIGSPEETAEQPAPVVVLSRPDFVAAVRDALRSLTRPDTLRANPLVRSRLALDLASGSAASSPVEALRALLLQAAEPLRASPRNAKLYQALDRTYVHPAPSQEAAAEALGLPFSTYRRHLKAGVEYLTDALWEREIGAAEG